MFSMPLLARAGGFPCFFAPLFKILEGFRKAQQDFGACFKKCLSFGIEDLGHVLTRVLGSIFQRLLQFLRVMAWIPLVLHRIGIWSPEEQGSIDPLSPTTYRRAAPNPYRIIPTGARRHAEMNFPAYSVSMYEVSSLGQHLL